MLKLVRQDAFWRQLATAFSINDQLCYAGLVSDVSNYLIIGNSMAVSWGAYRRHCVLKMRNLAELDKLQRGGGISAPDMADVLAR